MAMFFLGFSQIQGLEIRHEILIYLSPWVCPPMALSGALNAAKTGNNSSRYCAEGSSY
jgi:hypothetical protein